MSTKAIILAAGRGSRLYPLTLDKPKCLLEVGGQRIIDLQIERLKDLGVGDILMVVGYQRHVIMSELGATVRYRTYEGFDRTNNLQTLWSVREELNDDCLVLFADLVFEPEVLRRVMGCPEELCLVVDTGRVREGTMRVRLEADRVVEVGDQIPCAQAHGNFLGIAGIRQHGAERLVSAMSQLVEGHAEAYYTSAIDALAQQGVRICAVDVKGTRWAEIDTPEDLERAQAMCDDAQENRGRSRGHSHHGAS